MTKRTQKPYNETEAFISKNLGNFSCRKGWHGLIKLFLAELLVAGWSPFQPVFGKQKFGGLRISIEHNPQQVMLDIARKYEVLAGTTCELCGEPGKHRVINFWEQTLCTAHFLNNYPVIEVKNAGLDKVFRVGFESNYQRVKLYTRGFLAFSNEKMYASFHTIQINYYALLKAIPKGLLEDKDRQYIERFFSELSVCEVCGFRSVNLDSCKYCSTTVWNDDPDKWPNLSFYPTKEEYIKEMQMDWWWDDDDFRKLKTAYETAFEQVSNYQKVFTDDDLSKYIEEQKALEDDM